jgi:hypothetical protein
MKRNEINLMKLNSAGEWVAGMQAGVQSPVNRG